MRLKHESGLRIAKSIPAFYREGLLVRWWFVETVEDADSDLVNVSFELSDGTFRWCLVGTPDYLKRLLAERADPTKWSATGEPAVWRPHLIVIR